MNKQKTTGSYDESNPQVLNPFGYPLPAFDDTLSVISEEGHYWQREITVGGKPFAVRSFFQPVSQTTAREKLFRIIDFDIERKD